MHDRAQSGLLDRNRKGRVPLKNLTVKVAVAVGLALFACKGPVGPKGQTGETGSRGPSGASGAAGAPGTLVQVIEICPEVYGPFPEVLVRIGDSLLAVYSDGQKVHNTIILFNVPMRTTDGRHVDFMVTPDYFVECL